MSPLPHVDVDDVIIRRERSGKFTLSANAEPPQIVCESLEEALQRADSFATKRHAHVWYAFRGRTCMLADVKLLRRIWHEYVEMPGLRLTLEQARRLWAADTGICESALVNLIDLDCLARTPDGKYARHTEGAVAAPRFRMARAEGAAGHPGWASRRAR